MQLTPVTSSNIKAIGHDPEANELHVEFGDGSRWIYAGVDAFRYADMMKAESVGKYFHAYIRRNYEGRRFEEPEADAE